MKRITSACVIFLVLTFLAGCAAARITESMKSWEGHHFNELIASWGPPQQILDDGAGGRIFVYSETQETIIPGTADTTRGPSMNIGGMIYTPPAITTQQPTRIERSTSHRMFWIDRRGYVYRWAWKGL